MLWQDKSSFYLTISQDGLVHRTEELVDNWEHVQRRDDGGDAASDAVKKKVGYRDAQKSKKKKNPVKPKSYLITLLVVIGLTISSVKVGSQGLADPLLSSSSM